MFFAVRILIKFVDDLASNMVPIHFSKSGGQKQKYGKPHGYSSRSDSTRKTVAKQTSPKINRLC